MLNDFSLLALLNYFQQHTETFNTWHLSAFNCLLELIELLDLVEIIVLLRFESLCDTQLRVVTEDDIQCDVGEEFSILLLLTFIIKLVYITSKLISSIDNTLKLNVIRRLLRDAECTVNKSLLVNYYTDDNFVFIHNLKYLELNYSFSLSNPSACAAIPTTANISTVNIRHFTNTIIIKSP
nr:MAG TPA: hypothetical protein [Caudoviricetes sp.]